jgi:hypothetical protein
MTGSIRDPSEVMASRIALLAQRNRSRRSLLTLDRTPQKTYLKSPAVRVQTPKLNDLGSPSRVKVQRLLSYTEFDADMDDDNMDIGTNMDAAITESPTETVRPVPRRNGLAQQTRHKSLVLDDEEEVVVEEDEEEEEEIIGEDVQENDNEDYGAAFGDDSFEQNNQMGDMPEPQYENDQQSEDEQVEEPATPPPVRKAGRTKTQKSTVQSRAKKTKQPSSSQPAAKRPRTTPTASQSIIERKEYPHAADVSTMDGDGTLPLLLPC